MKKLLCCFLIVATLNASAAAVEHNNRRLILGFVLTLAGTLAAVDGYSRVKDDLSNPSLESTNFTWEARSDQKVYSSGTLTNRGNVTIDRVTLTISYFDSANTFIFNDTAPFGPLAVDQSSTWNSNFHYDAGKVPARAELSTLYSYTILTRVRTKNETEGIAGAACAAFGIYLVCKSIFSMDHIDEYLDSHGLNLRITRNNGIGLAIVKYI